MSNRFAGQKRLGFGRKSGLYLLCSAAAWMAVQERGLAQTIPIEKISPSQTIMLGDIVAQQLGGYVSRNGLQALSQANGVWAVLFYSSVGRSVITSDSHGPAHAFPTAVDVEQVAVDQDAHIHLVHRYLWPENKRVVSVFDLLGNQVTEYSIPIGLAQPFLTGSGLLWKSGNALAAAHTFIPLMQLDGSRDVNDAFGESPFVGAVGGGYFTFGSHSEMITIHRSDGSIVSSGPAPLDAAYKAIGALVPKPPTSSDYVRVLWASTARSGSLYVGLSGLPVSGPAYIAVIDPQTRTLQKVITATLPSFRDEISRLNPLGTMFAAMGTIDDQLIIADEPRGVLAIY